MGGPQDRFDMATEDDRVETPTSANGQRVAGWRVVFALSALGVLIAGGLFFASRNAASSKSNSPDQLPTPVVSNDQACANFAQYWLNESGLDLDASVVEGLSNCRQSDDGTWFVPAGSFDARFPAGTKLTAEEREFTATTRQQLLAQIDGLQGQISDSMQRDLNRIYDARVRPITGHLRDGVGISRPRSRYTRLVQAYTLSPERELLSGYVAWLMNAKITAYDTLRSECETNPAGAYLLTACRGLEDSLSVRFAPYVWDLQSSVNLDAYLAYLARTNQIPGQTKADADDTGAGLPFTNLAILRTT